jgi:hypothetical protein
VEQYRLGIETGSILGHAAAAFMGPTPAASPKARVNGTQKYLEGKELIRAFLLPISTAFHESYGWAFNQKVCYYFLSHFC